MGTSQETLDHKTVRPGKPKKVRMKRAPLTDGRESEVEAYAYILKQLATLGWKMKNPSRFPDSGQVWTQNQCLSNPHIKAAFGAMHPENVVKLAEDKVWIIEAKADKAEVGKALSEAINDYAKPVNDGGKLKALLATGVAGNEESGYLVQTRILLEGLWEKVTINGKVATGLLAPKDVEALVSQNTSDVHDYAPPPKAFLDAAEDINGYLHVGGINKNDRAKVMAALLLSVINEPGPNVDTKLPVLIGEINTRAKNILIDNDKGAYAPFIEIITPPNTSNHFKYRLALVKTLQELRNLNIRSAMNSSTDVLGQFYEVFLKYGNGAKEIGIILTPRHITRFAVEALGFTSRDIILDPACGTGGFLVAAFDHARRNFSDIEWFRKNNLFGIEQEPTVAVLAIVNMIFRGDGKNHIIEGNCFNTWLEAKAKNSHVTAQLAEEKPENGQEAITRILMNPPFALRDSKEREYHFVSHALEMMVDGGLLFSLLPLDAMFGTGREKTWRQDELLKKHTLLGVISFPEELFYPAAQKQVVALIVKKGHPHPNDAPVFWACIKHDGHLKVKKKRLPASALTPPRDELDQLVEVLPHLQRFIQHPESTRVNIPLVCKTAPIDFNDPAFELLPEAYVDSKAPTVQEIEEGIDESAREAAAFIIGYNIRTRRLAPKEALPAVATQETKTRASVGKAMRYRPFQIGELYEITPGDYHSQSSLTPGAVPLVSCGDRDNGIIGYYLVPKGKQYSNRLTVAFNGRPLTAKFHPYAFAAKDDVAVCTPLRPLRPTTEFFIQMVLNGERWRYSYYRKCYAEKLHKFQILLPATGGKVDEDSIQALVEANPYWSFIRQSWSAPSP